MLMNSSTRRAAGHRLAQLIDAMLGVLWLHTKQLYKVIRHRRGIATLAGQDDYLLADIGLTRNDVRRAMGEPFWRDPSESLRRCRRSSFCSGTSPIQAEKSCPDRKALGSSWFGSLPNVHSTS